jgi:hypothetical protein
MASALAALGEAYEELDEYAAERLEESLFRPLQVAYGRANRTHAEFAKRRGFPGHAFQPQPCGLPSRGAKGHVEQAVEAVRAADQAIAELQDSMLPVEYGDPELRAGPSDVHERIGGLPAQAREILRTLGR